MKKISLFLAGLLFYAPFGARAALPLVAILLIGAGAGIAGFSIYRSFVPVNVSDALAYFSSCWSCGVFSGIFEKFSNFIPGLYSAIGEEVVPIAAGLVVVWFAWEKILKGFLTAKSEPDAWKITADLGTRMIKLAFVAILLAFPLPRFLTRTFAAPIMNVGLAYNGAARNYTEPEGKSFRACVVATAVGEAASAGGQAADTGAFSAKLRHNMSCQIAELHKITGLGMTLGWTFAQMAFDKDYMHQLGPTGVPIFPNTMLIFAGLAIMMMFLWALLPVPLYFLEVFIKLSFDLIMLPLTLLGWLFGDWADIFPSAKGGIKKIVDDAVKNACGIALVGLFMGFAILFLNEVIGGMNDMDALIQVLQNGDQNGGKYLMDSLMMNNKSMISVVFAGLFIGMFMNAIPTLTKELFKDVAPSELFKNSETWLGNISKVLKNAAEGVGKKIKSISSSSAAT